MADTPDTPTTGSDTTATPRRRSSRGTGTTRTKGATKASTPRRTTRKTAAADATAAVKATATRAKRAAKKVESAAADAVKSPSRRSPSRTAKSPRKPGAPRKAADKGTGKWGVAAIAGGLAAAGAAAAALLSLKGSTPKTAHQPDGQDASKSFDAKIADENTVPS